MGRKRETPADKRRGYVPVGLLRQYADDLMTEATRLREQADKIESAGMKEIYSDGIRKFGNAFPDIAGFVNNIYKGMLDAGIR